MMDCEDEELLFDEHIRFPPKEIITLRAYFMSDKAHSVIELCKEGLELYNRMISNYKEENNVITSYVVDPWVRYLEHIVLCDICTHEA